jgi:hypothetical protein
MSSRYVRNLTEQWAAAPALGVPFYPTVNMEQNPSDQIWFTLEWDAFGATKDTFCETFTEDGEVRMVFFGPAGAGYDALLAAAETAARLFYGNIDPAGRLVLSSLGAPDEFGGQDQSYFVVEIAIEYTFQKQ